MAENKIKIIAVKTKDGLFIAGEKYGVGYYNCPLEDLYFNGTPPQKTYKTYWYFIAGGIQSIEREQSQPPINKRYILSDLTLKSDKIKERFEHKDTLDKNGEMAEWFCPLFSLYVYEEDKQPKAKVPVEYELIIVAEVEDVQQVMGFNYPTVKEWSKKHALVIGSDRIRHQMLDEMIFPAILLSNRPCKLSSEDSYKLVRKHVQENINTKYAYISSDYDFCFTVKKKIELPEPRKFTYNANILTRRKPKYVFGEQAFRDEEVFEMTYSPRNDRGYTPIQPFAGKSHEDLKKVIDTYLNNLMAKINEPLQDCKVCMGIGVVVDKTSKNSEEQAGKK